MKIAVSLPDELFRQADEAAAQLGMSRSQLYARALESFLDGTGNDEDPVTVALNAVADRQDPAAGTAAARALITAGNWEW